MADSTLFQLQPLDQRHRQKIPQGPNKSHIIESTRASPRASPTGFSPGPSLRRFGLIGRITEGGSSFVATRIRNAPSAGQASLVGPLQEIPGRRCTQLCRPRLDPHPAEIEAVGVPALLLEPVDERLIV